MKTIITLLVLFFLFCTSIFSQTTIIHQADFETVGNDGWTDGGTDASDTNITAYSGSWSLTVRDDTSTSNWTSPSFALSAYDKVDFKFFFSTGGYDADEIFYIEYRDNSAASWNIIASYAARNISDKNADFQSGDYPSTFYAKTATIFKTTSIFPIASTAQFRVRSNSNLDSDLIYFDMVTISGTTYKTPTIGPGGITNNLDLWLRADKVDGITIASDGSNVSKWVDNGKGNDAEVVVSGQEPVYRNSVAKNMNFNPVIDFENNNNTSGADMSYINTRDELKGTGGFNSNDIFMVVMPDPTITTSMIPMDAFTSTDPIGSTYSEDVTGFGYGSYTARFNGELFTYCIGVTSSGNGYGRCDLSGSNNYNQLSIMNVRQNSTNTDMAIYQNANKVGNTTNDISKYAMVNNTRYWLGRSQYWNGSFDGRIAEVITYSTRKNDVTERNRIESYLAIKYGITLGINGTSQDYVDSAGNVIWDQSANAGYNYDITGIGRDDDSALNQKQSKSVNSDFDGTGQIRGLVTMGLSNIYATNSENVTANATTFNNKEYLTWGNNNGNLDNAPNVVNVDMSDGIAGLSTPVSFTGMERVWKVVEHGGDIPMVKVSIPKNAVRNITPPGSYLMFISSTGVFDPTADYRVMTDDGTNLEAEYDFDATKYITFGYAPETIVERSIYFDGVVDYIDMEDALDLNASEFTVSAWIKRGANSANTSILSKRDATYTEGYDFKITNTGLLQMVWNGGTQIVTSSTVIPQNKWHHVAVIYNGGTATLYIDGIADGTVSSLTNPVATTQSFYIAAAGKNTPTAFFEGNIDEVRVWDVALSEDQLHYIMNQELVDKSITTGLTPLPLIRGNVIPIAIQKNEISTIPWSNLAGYYPLSVYTYTNTNDMSGNGHQGALRNLDTVDWQTAPLPYVSNADGVWGTPATWLNNTIQDLPNGVSIVDGVTPINWNIVQTAHNITSGDKDITVLGLISTLGKLTIADPVVTSPVENNDGQSLIITHYLELDGVIDLVGESQLVQTEGCILDQDSGGYIEKDQQGTANSFNYNYWSSSVGPISGNANARGTGIASINSNSILSGTLLDGTVSAIPQGITFNASYAAADSGPSIPISISSFWLYTYNGISDSHNPWNAINQNTPLIPGEGYTMKGSSGAVALATNQNYVFKGKPNNGTITLPIIAGNDRLIGNPYASAIDADEFIKDNIKETINSKVGRNGVNVFNGALYFWHHFGEENSHILKEYVGGYATYTLMGGTEAISNDSRINNNLSTGGKVPERYIPVNQGFFVNAYLPSSLSGTTTTVDGGDIIFKNSQRVFQREVSNLGNGSVFFKPTIKKIIKAEAISIDSREKIRLIFDSPAGYHRHLLIGLDNNASNGFDIGYDAPISDIGSEDMFWIVDEAKFVIQAVSNFKKHQEFPIGLKIQSDGLVRIKVDTLENFNKSKSIFIKDYLTGKTYDINKKAFEIILKNGEYLDRFALTFTPGKKRLKELTIEDKGIYTHMDNQASKLQVNNTIDTEIINITLFNYLGQVIENWNRNFKEKEFSIPISHAQGVYFLQITTLNGTISKKIIIE
ncbi:LamG-like jellyroll fold domain-containing protein [Lutibacter sp.]|uniref:LamG-like jellyroll fold domain-containing protein n=1 Tax=Lutibacter sp. TaxID=1925666 RepID=UPI0035623AFA